MSVHTPKRVHNAEALYELTVSDGKFIVTASQTTTPFSRADYSQFKYGRRDVAERYGAAIAALLVDYYAAVGNEPIVVIGTPYKRLPNAARMLAITAERHLRAAGLPVNYSYIYQHHLADGDYGTLPAHLRDQRNMQKKRYIDPDDFAAKHVVIIDDVRITGSIERSILALLEHIPVLGTTVVNLVRLDPSVAHKDPSLEDQLNHYAMTSLEDLLGLIGWTDNFTLTTRAVKYILRSDPSAAQVFLDQLNARQIIELYEAIVDEGYDQMPRHFEVFRLVCDACQNLTRKREL